MAIVNVERVQDAARTRIVVGRKRHDADVDNAAVHNRRHADAFFRHVGQRHAPNFGTRCSIQSGNVARFAESGENHPVAIGDTARSVGRNVVVRLPLHAAVGPVVGNNIAEHVAHVDGVADDDRCTRHCGRTNVVDRIDPPGRAERTHIRRIDRGRRRLSPALVITIQVRPVAIFLGGIGWRARRKWNRRRLFLGKHRAPVVEG